ncbi:MAG: penicillin-binding protein beta-lactamase class [Chthonomonadaceae bacterium]|nr:penicillin-binding protein beta-lactamase class [Chthonomonadaceae bacterium]
MTHPTGRQFNRRYLLKSAGQTAAAMALASFLPGRAIAGDATDIPITGKAVPSLSGFDDLLQTLLREHKIPGASLAIARHGRLIYARGFGYADREAREPVQPDSLFRIASISKSFTSAAIMQLVERNKLKLSDHPFALLDIQPFLEGNATVDPRLRQITIHQLLCHTGGFEREKGFDPMFQPEVIAKALNVKSPPGPKEIIRYMMGRQLDFDPGSKESYSNFGYCVLGRVIEKITGDSYIKYVQRELLLPLGISRMQLGRSLQTLKAPGEVRYYPPYDGLSPNLFGGPDTLWCYGGFHLEAMDSHGGWIASAPDLVRFASSLDNPKHCPILRPGSIKELFARPRETGYTADGAPKPSYYAAGWHVHPMEQHNMDTWHDGLFDGTSALLLRRHDGLTWAVLFNTDHDENKQVPADLVGLSLHTVADAVKEWPEDRRVGRRI